MGRASGTCAPVFGRALRALALSLGILLGTGCEPLRTAYVDLDGDGFGSATAPPLRDYPSTPGTATNADDCFDDDARAHPGQTQSFAEDRGDGSFDYDCDGVEQPEHTATSSGYLNCAYGTCMIAQGWVDGPVPGCGESESWLGGCTLSPCAGVVEERQQRCR